MKSLVYVIMLSVFCSCASYTPGEFGQMVQTNSDETIAVSASRDDVMSEGSFDMVNFYFYNPSDKDWRRIKSIEILDIPNNPDARIIVGKDLYYWAKAMEHKIAIDNHNREMLLGTVAALGAVTAVAGAKNGSNATTGIGLGVMLGAATASDVNALMNRVSDLERASLIPESHLYSPFSIPPGLVTNKWLVIQKLNKRRVCAVKIKVTFTDSTTVVFNNKTTEFSCLE